MHLLRWGLGDEYPLCIRPGNYSVEASPWGMFGLANMFEFLNEVKQITPELEVAGIAVTKVDTRKSYYKQTMETLHELEDIHVFEQIIRVDSSVEWSQDNSIPVVEYKNQAEVPGNIRDWQRRSWNYVSRQESIRRAANAGAGKNVKKPVVSAKMQRNRKQYLFRRKEKQQKVLFILMRNCLYIFFKIYL